MSLLILKKSVKILNKVKKVHACTLHKIVPVLLKGINKARVNISSLHFFRPQPVTTLCLCFFACEISRVCWSAYSR